MIGASSNVYSYSVTGIWLLALIFLASCQGIQSYQSVIINMSYHDAREIILHNGWVPVQANRSDMDAEYRLPHFYYDAGYTEVMACSGTGMGYCVFKFQNKKGEYLKVITRGGDYSLGDTHPPTVAYVRLSEDFD